VLWKLSHLRPKDTGIMRVPSYMYFDEKTDDTVNPWWKDVVPDVGIIKQPPFLVSKPRFFVNCVWFALH
jgi:hypothetical protein